MFNSIEIHALLSSRFTELNNHIFKLHFHRYFFAQEVVSHLYRSICSETDILVGMALASELKECPILNDEENKRLARLSQNPPKILNSEDAGILATLSIIQLRNAIYRFEVANEGWLKNAYFEHIEETKQQFESLMNIYRLVKEHPQGHLFNHLIHRAMELTKFEVMDFIDERPVYEVTVRRKGNPLPEFLLKMVERLYFKYSENNGKLYVCYWGINAKDIIPSWATIIQAHHPELRIVKSTKKYSEIKWQGRSCNSWNEAIYRESLHSSLESAREHKKDSDIDPYQKLMRLTY